MTAGEVLEHPQPRKIVSFVNLSHMMHSSFSFPRITYNSRLAGLCYFSYLCNATMSFLQRPFHKPFGWPRQEEFLAGTISQEAFYQHHTSLQELESSANSGCDLCALITDCFKGTKNTGKISRTITFCRYTVKDNGHRKWQIDKNALLRDEYTVLVVGACDEGEDYVWISDFILRKAPNDDKDKYERLGSFASNNLEPSWMSIWEKRTLKLVWFLLFLGEYSERRTI
jgi:hypothetical protein